MKQPEYTEGPKAHENLEDGMRTIFQSFKGPVKAGEGEAYTISVLCVNGIMLTRTKRGD
jgi:hypothetical protein